MHVHAPHPGPVVRLTALGMAANDDDRVEQMTHVQRLQLCETCGHALATLACLLLYCGISLESEAHADITRQPEHSNVYVSRFDTAENTQSVGAGGTAGGSAYCEVMTKSCSRLYRLAMVMSGMKMPSQLHSTLQSHGAEGSRAPASTGGFTTDHSGGQQQLRESSWRKGAPVPHIELVGAVPAAVGAGRSDAVRCRVPVQQA